MLNLDLDSVGLIDRRLSSELHLDGESNISREWDIKDKHPASSVVLSQ